MDYSLRNRLLLGEDGMDRLKSAHVMVFGCGGVGSFAIEALARAGIGHLSLVDFDRIEISNLNRQLMTTQAKLGQLKVEVMKERLLSINPELIVTTHALFFKEDTDLDFTGVDYVIDAIDSVPSKIELMRTCERLGLPLIMALGTARKLDPTQLQVTRLSKTTIDPLAKKIRILAKKEGLKDILVVSSTEAALDPSFDKTAQKVVNGSMIFVPGSAGLLLASVVVRALCGRLSQSTAK